MHTHQFKNMCVCACIYIYVHIQRSNDSARVSCSPEDEKAFLSGCPPASPSHGSRDLQEAEMNQLRPG